MMSGFDDSQGLFMASEADIRPSNVTELAGLFDNTLYHQPEGPGLEAIAEDFRHLGFKDNMNTMQRKDRLRCTLRVFSRDGKARQATRRVRELYRSSR
jgi:hypothetical protein